MISKSDLINFENIIVRHWEEGDLPYLLHLAGGNEKELLDIFSKCGIRKKDWVFSTHRSHYHYILKVLNKVWLKKKIMDGNSMFLFDRKNNFFSSSIVCGTPCIASGVSLALKMQKKDSKVYCFIGDGAEDEGHLYEAVRFVKANRLPCRFIIEDNDRSVSSSKKDRWGKYDQDIDWSWTGCVERYKYTPVYPHAGNGTRKRIIFKDCHV